jgi:chemotaxis protein methyltransferase WspC
MRFSYEEIKELTAKNFGISTSSIGDSFTKDCLDSYIKKLDIEGMSDKTDNQEKFLEGFFEYIKVAETWFFRQPESFRYLKTIAQNKLHTTKEKIRILSIASSTGEEAYSIAMALESSCIGKESYILDAVELSAVSLEKAKAAVYSKNSFRQTLTKSEQEYFEKEGELHRVRSDIRMIPNFIKGNFLNTNVLNSVEKYDIIFCRNLLIYFTDSARKAAINKIKDLLNDDGLVFTGYSEFVFFLQNGFHDLEQKLSFACKLGEISQKPELITVKKRSPLKKPILKSDINQPTKDIQPSVNDESTNKFWELEILANSGELENAKELALKACESDSVNPKELTICGAVFSACEMQEKAIVCLERAIYLNPNEEEALMHLALIYENMGKIQQAELLKNRARKLNSGGIK